MSINTRIKKIEQGLKQRHSSLYQKPELILIEQEKGETSEQAITRYERENNKKIFDRDLVVILNDYNEPNQTGDE